MDNSKSPSAERRSVEMCSTIPFLLYKKRQYRAVQPMLNLLDGKACPFVKLYASNVQLILAFELSFGMGELCIKTFFFSKHALSTPFSAIYLLSVV